jgi:NitT/TauT family transport system ATP-binding protein
MEKGKIKRVIDNAYFGDEDMRNNMDFYRLCLEVRKWLNEEA